jgi:hypothetical protein
MNGEAPVVIPTTFKNTKFPSVAEKIKNLVTSREEALAAHGGKNQVGLCPIQERSNGLARLKASEDELS